jgi:DUF1680 family protein
MLNSPAAVIVDTRRSPYAYLKPVSIQNIVLNKGFWQTRYLTNLSVTIPNQFKLLQSTGSLDNFKRVSGHILKPFHGYVFNDSDVYKWLEAASWSLAIHPDGELCEQADLVIDLIGKAQDRDGYVNSYFSLDKIRERWMNLQEKHELYCAGHLIQAAIAHHRTTLEEKFINIATRLADHICLTFGPSQVVGTPGHPEIEIALVELFRATGDQKYLQQAQIFIDRRGKGLLGKSEYLVDHSPLRELDRLAGHAVRALYLCSGATDLVLETGEKKLSQNLEHLWKNMARQQMYLTGGVGSRHEGEAFGDPYELPNARAYAETCAAIANVMWNWRLLSMNGKAQYADLLEWTLFNAVLPGISLDGNSYFYVNPLADDGFHRRQEWFDCACCPPNIARTLAALPGYLYSTSKEGIWVNLYTSSRATLELQNGLRVTLEQSTAYPWDGNIRLKIVEISSLESTSPGADEQTPFSLYFRIPGWMEGKKVTLRINDQPTRYQADPGSYMALRQPWKTGDILALSFPMKVRFLESHPAIHENVGRAAITRGPLVYCLEAIDNPKMNISQVVLDPSFPIESEYLPELLGGVVRLRMPGFTYEIDPGWDEKLYRPVHSARIHRRHRQSAITFIPYFAWANREPGMMSVWQTVK